MLVASLKKCSLLAASLVALLFALVLFSSIGTERADAATTTSSNGTATTEFAYTGGQQTFTAPYTGTYTLKVWGAQGGNDGPGGGAAGATGGKGGYATGVVSLTKGEVLYVYVGQKGDSSWSNPYAAYNGGGKISAETGAGGGGASHIAKSAGLLASFSNPTNAKNNGVLIVAGGGGGAGNTADGGTGGGTNGGRGVNNSSSTLPAAATATSGYAFGKGQDGSGENAAGGGGWYGGYASVGGSTMGAGGGSGWVGGTGVSSGSMSNGQRSGHGLAQIIYKNPYKIAFNANGGSGTMANQDMVYGTAANLNANQFTRNYTITYNANGAPANFITKSNWSCVRGTETWSGTPSGPLTSEGVAFVQGGGDPLVVSYDYTIGGSASQSGRLQFSLKMSATTYGDCTVYTPVTGQSSGHVEQIVHPTANNRAYGERFLITITMPTGTDFTISNLQLQPGSSSSGYSPALADTDTSVGTFKGWATSATGAKAYDNQQSVNNLTTTLNGTVNLYALWENPSVPLRQCSWKGHEFLGWSLSATDSTHLLPANYTPTSDVTVYAQWRPYVLTLQQHANGGTMDGISTIGGNTHQLDQEGYFLLNGSRTLRSDAYGTISDDFCYNVMTAGNFRVYRTGYHVVSGQEYNLSPDGTGRSLDQTIGYYPEDIDPRLETQDVTVTAYVNWKPNTYTVVFDGNNQPSQNLPGNVAATYDQAGTVPVGEPTASGYQFTGWNTDPDGNGTPYAAGVSFSNLTAEDGGEVRLYAQWEYVPVATEYGSGGLSLLAIIPICLGAVCLARLASARWKVERAAWKVRRMLR